MNNDILALRELAKQYIEIANKPIQETRREIWRRQNSFENTSVPIYVRAFAFDEFFDKNILKCEDPLLRKYEYFFHMMKFRDTLGDDFIIEPWVSLDAIYKPTIENRWGVAAELGEKPSATGAAHFSPELLEEEDFKKLVVPRHEVDEEATRLNFDKLHSAIGDIVEIDLNRGSVFTMWTGDISTDLAKLRGLEQIMWDVYDRPEWLHKLLAFMRDGILKVHEEAERCGDFSLTCHQNQNMPYCRELSDPKPNTHGVMRKELWYYMASQEYTTFGPQMFDEFLLEYQIPILEKFGMTAYGCCEDLTQKIDLLKKIPNLRRIAVTPFSKPEACAEVISKDYILSWRPNPALMLSNGLDEDFVRKYMRKHFEIFKANNNLFDITLKDVETVKHQPENVRRWVSIVREEIANAF